MRLTLRLPFHERLAAALLALVFTFGFFYEYLPPFKHVHFPYDIAGYHYPLQRYAFDALKGGRFPHWDASNYCGYSFAGNLQAAAFYPPNWLMYALSWRCQRLPYKAVEAFAIAHLWVAFLLCCGWLRARRLNGWPAILGAGVFAFGGYMLSQITHLGAISSMTWIPLGLWGIDDALERRTWRPLWKTALASALSFCAGYPASWLAFCATMFFYALASRGTWRTAAGAVAAIAASLFVAFAQWVPALEAHGVMRTEEKYAAGWQHASWLLTFFIPNWFDANRRSALLYPEGVWYLYLGLPAIFALGWIVWRRNPRPYFQPLITAAACFLLVTNPWNAIYTLVRHISFFENTAQTYNFYEGMQAMAALLTALALDDFLRSRAGKSAPRALAPLAILALVAWSARQILLWRHGGMFPTQGLALAETAMAVLLFSIAFWTMAGESGARRRWLAVALFLTVAIDYKVFGTSRNFNAENGDSDKEEDATGIRGMNQDAWQALRANHQYRVAGDSAGAPVPTDYRYWGFASPQGFDPFLPAQYHDFIERFVRFKTNRMFDVNFQNERMLQSLGVRYVITHEGVGHSAQLAADTNFRLIGPDDSYYRVYEYLHAQAPYGFEDAGGSVRPTAWLAERRAFTARSDRGGRFFFVEQFYPGWTATVDGRSVPISRWNGAFQSIPVPPGAHTIVFQYRTPYFFLSLAISFAALVALAFFALSDWRRPRFRHLEIALTVREAAAE